MKFKLSMDEVGDLCRTHIETQYGRRTGTLLFDIGVGPKSLDVLIDDAGALGTGVAGFLLGRCDHLPSVEVHW